MRSLVSVRFQCCVATAVSLVACAGSNKSGSPGQQSSAPQAGAAQTPGANPSSQAPAAGSPVTMQGAAGSAAPGGSSSTTGPATAQQPASNPSAGGAAGPTSSAPDAGTQSTPATTPTKPMLYWLDISAGAVYRANEDGSDAHSIATGNGISAPDGVSVDVEGGHLYWTNMGSALGGANLGTVQRAALDGTSIETIVPAGVGNTYKQMTIDHMHHKLYWCDREGAKVWRANMDGSQHEVLASAHGFNQLVGIALDVPRAQFYFTDRNARKIMRAGFDMPAGQTDANRMDIEDLIVLASGAMPIDLDLDLDKRMLYFTDRGVGTVNRLPMDLPAGQTAADRKDMVAIVTGLSDPIGITLDLEAGAIFFGDLTGQLWRTDLNGSGRSMLAHSTSITGVTLARLPAK